MRKVIIMLCHREHFILQKPCEDCSTRGCFPSQPHPGKRCCLSIDLQVNPMSPDNFLNGLQSAARTEVLGHRGLRGVEEALQWFSNVDK